MAEYSGLHSFCRSYSFNFEETGMANARIRKITFVEMQHCDFDPAWKIVNSVTRREILARLLCDVDSEE